MCMCFITNDLHESADSPGTPHPCLVSSRGMLNRLTDSNSPGCWHRATVAYSTTNTEIIKKRRTIPRHVLHNHWLLLRAAACPAAAATTGVDDDNALVDDGFKHRLHHSVDLVVAARLVRLSVLLTHRQAPAKQQLIQLTTGSKLTSFF